MRQANKSRFNVHPEEMEVLEEIPLSRNDENLIDANQIEVNHIADNQADQRQIDANQIAENHTVVCFPTDGTRIPHI